MLWIAAPLSTVFWIVGSSACVVGAHAGIMEPGIESWVVSYLRLLLLPRSVV